MRRIKLHVAVFASFTILSLLFFWPIFTGKVNLNGNLLVSFYAPYGENLPFKATGWDQLRIYFPFYKITLDSLKNWQIPLWNPYAFSGHPHMADFQTAVFYPLNIFGLILPQIEFWHLLRITPMILAGLFTFLYLRNLRLDVILETRRVDRISNGILSLRSRMTNKNVRMTNKGGGLSNLASLFGALSFGLSPFILTWGEEVVMSPHSIVWLPLILWAIEKFLAPPSRHPEPFDKTQGKLRGGSRSLGFIKRFFVNTQNDKAVYLAIIALSTAFSFFSGYMQTTIYMLLFSFAYLIFRIWQFKDYQARLVKLVQAGLGILVGIGLAAIQLIPSAELYFNAARSQISLREQLFNFLLPIESIFTFLAPDFFGHPATANFFQRGDAQYYEGILFVGVAALIFVAYSLLPSLAHLGGVKALRYNSGQAHPRGGSRLTKFMAISAIVALLTTIDWFGAKLFLSLPIPFLSTSIPNRVLFIPAFCLAVLAALGFEKWHKEQYKRAYFAMQKQKVNSKYQIFKAILIIAGIYAGILVTLLWVKVFGIEYFEHGQFKSDQHLLISFRNLVIPLAVFTTTVLVTVLAGVYHWFSKQTAAILIIALSFLHIFYFSQKYFSFSDRGRIFPKNEVLEFIQMNQGYYRSWGVGDAFFENNFATQYGVFWPEGYDSLNNRSYGEFTYAMQGADLTDFVFRADAGLGRGKIQELVENQNRRRLVDMVGVKYVIGKVSDREILERSGFKIVFSQDFELTSGESEPFDSTQDKPTSEVFSSRRQDFTSEVKDLNSDGYAVFENLTVMPRAFLASNYEGPPPLDGSGQATEEVEKVGKIRRTLIFEKLLSDDFDFRNVVILEKPSPISPQFGPGTAEILSYKPQEVVIKTVSDQPKLLFLSDNYYPGWKATVDGDETEILRANYTFRAVPLVPGEHEVRFYYDSDSFKRGLFISLLGLFGLSLFLLNSKFKMLRGR